MQRFLPKLLFTLILVLLFYRPDFTMNGVHTYSISYKVTNGMDANYADHDEFYWNATGNEWKVPIQSVSAGVDMGFE